MADAVPLSGGIDPKAFPFLVGHLHRQGATGSLKVEGPSYQKAIYFRGGRVLFGSSNDPKDQLGAILIESGRISPEQLGEVNAKVGPGNPLAKVLAESGFVSQRELSESARAKVERILSDVLGYTTGSFEFEDGVLPKGAVDLKLATEKVIVAAVRRISDRNFVLRHVEGLDAVLAPTAQSAGPLAEIEADTGPLARMFDGRRTLKEAASAAALDEFDASKIASALLFLGLVERSNEAAADTTLADAEPLFTTADLDSGLDLGGTLRIEAPAELPVPRPTDATLPIPGPAPAPEPPLAEPPIPPPAPRLPAPEPATMILPPAPGPQAAIQAGPTLGLSDASFGAVQEEEPETPAPATPPSKEDLAALDALLNARNVEGPLEPMTKSAEPRWEPHFAQAGQRRGNRTGSGDSRRPLLLGGAAAVLVVAGVAGWTLFLRPAPGTPSHTNAPATLVATTTTTLSPTPPTTLVAPDTTAVAAPVTTLAQKAAAAPAPPPLADARSALRKGEFGVAARGFVANLRSAGGDTHTIQILVACSDDTVQKAVQAVSAADLFIVPVDYKGKSCYRVCWGIYDSEGKARAAVASVPGYFTTNGARPKAVQAATVLP
jgi:septal ring-binding cell division protein DamX